LNKDEVFMKHLLETFKIEASEHLNEITLLLVELENMEHPLEETAKIEVIFRGAHSLKGAARAVNQDGIEKMCQLMEGVFSKMKKGTLILTSDVFDLLQETVDYLSKRIRTIEKESNPDDENRSMNLCGRLEKIKTRVQIEESPSPEVPAFTLTKMPAVPAAEETLRVSSARLSSVLLQSEEMLSAKLSAKQIVKELKGIQLDYGNWKKEWAKVLPAFNELNNYKNQERIGALLTGPQDEELRSLNKVLEFINWNGNFIKASEACFKKIYKETQQNSNELDGMIDNLLDDAKKMVMFPFSSLLEMLPKIVRDISKDVGKSVVVEIQGGEIEIDRRILDEMRDPMIHIIRNCVDHGIETPEERKGKGKPTSGKISIEVFPRDHRVELKITDDGKGMSLEKLKEAIQKTESMTRERMDSLSKQELISYAFNSGVSTSEIITELSGRGLGLAIVRERIEKIGGTIGIETDTDVGTTFQIILPLTIANFRGILISTGGQEFILPTMYVERIMRERPEHITTVENREIVLLRGTQLSLVRMSTLLGIEDRQNQSEDYLQIVILCANGVRMAFVVDQILGEQEVLIRNLGPQLARVKNIAGATVMGSGRVVPILNVADLMITGIKLSGNSVITPKSRMEKASNKAVPSVLIVEDSITTRALLKNIMQTAGYYVHTATDGLDALIKIRSYQYDVVLSDIEMPRMNGFELIENIRNDKNMKDLPVVLITALASKEDQARGIDVGANAYIVKSVFDQSNLLNVVKLMLRKENQ